MDDERDEGQEQEDVQRGLGRRAEPTPEASQPELLANIQSLQADLVADVEEQHYFRRVGVSGRNELLKSISERFARINKRPETAGKEQSAAGPLLATVNSIADRMGKLEAQGGDSKEGTSTGGLPGDFRAPPSSGAQSAMPQASATAAQAGSSQQPAESPEPAIAEGYKLSLNAKTGGVKWNRQDFLRSMVPGMHNRAPQPPPREPDDSSAPAAQDNRGAQAQPEPMGFNPNTGGVSGGNEDAETKRIMAAMMPAGASSPMPGAGSSGTPGGRMPSGLGNNPAMAQMLKQATAMGGAGPGATGGTGGGVQEMLSKGTSGAGGLGDREILERLLEAMEELTQVMKQSKEGQGQQPGPQPGGGFVPGGPQRMAGNAEFGAVESGGFPSLRTGIPSPGMAAVARSRGP